MPQISPKLTRGRAVTMGGENEERKKNERYMILLLDITAKETEAAKTSWGRLLSLSPPARSPEVGSEWEVRGPRGTYGRGARVG